MAASEVGDDLLPLQDNYSDDKIAFEEDAFDDLSMFRRNCNVLTETDIHDRLKDTIAEVSGVLSVSKTEASILLRHYNWSVDNVIDEWFADENVVREKVGLFVNELSDPALSDYNIVCGNCFEDYPYVSLKSTYCGHLYCNDCWSSYIKTAISDGPQSLLLKCPEPSCRAAVREDMMGLFASEQEKVKYDRYVVLSYVEANREEIKWCPGPGCENAVYFVAGSESLDVTCLCSHSFCWNCTQEAHRPVDCEAMTDWMSKHSSESESLNYILAFTKPCPKCKIPIEKNEGCDHMICRAPCCYQFCWLCLQDWGNHDTFCNRVTGNPEEEERQKAKKYMIEYNRYFEHWTTNKNLMRKAIADLQNVRTKQRVQEQAVTVSEIRLLTETWQQIIECRKVLTWTYVYGFYLTGECQTKRNLFEYLQGQAKSFLERLQDCAEIELVPFLEHGCSDEFRAKLISLTMVTRNYFGNFVTALQNGLSDVKSEGSSSVSKKRKSILTAPSAAAAVTVTAMEQWACAYCSFQNLSSATSCAICERGSWTCDTCTYANSRTSTTCEMCSAAMQCSPTVSSSSAGTSAATCSDAVGS